MNDTVSEEQLESRTGREDKVIFKTTQGDHCSLQNVSIDLS